MYVYLTFESIETEGDNTTQVPNQSFSEKNELVMWDSNPQHPSFYRHFNQLSYIHVKAALCTYMYMYMVNLDGGVCCGVSGINVSIGCHI